MSTTPTVDNIREGFPHPTVPKHSGLPTYETIKKVHQILKANAASVSSVLSGGQHGLLGLVLTNPIYQHVTGTTFQRPPLLPAFPAIPDDTAILQTQALERRHNASLRTYKEVQRTDQALQQQLLSAFDNMYFQAVRDHHVGYTNVTTLQLLTHLYANYGLVTQNDLSDNDAAMKRPYDPSAPIESLFQQIEDGVEFAEAGHAPYTPQQIIAIAYFLVFQTGIFEKYCDEWDEKPQQDKSWINFKSHFTRAHQRYRAQQHLKQASFNRQQANHMATSEFEQDVRESLQALMIAKESNENNTTSLLQMIEGMKTSIRQLEGEIQSLKTTIKAKSTYDVNCEAYCWTHGRTRNPNHNSSSCRNKSDGHKDEATLNNRMGGSNARCT